jgi:Bacterial regulatory helix-turn-helix protein, lysR family
MDDPVLAIAPRLGQFVAVARAEHMTQAATEIDVPQSSLSRSIARLETDLGSSSASAADFADPRGELAQRPLRVAEQRGAGPGEPHRAPAASEQRDGTGGWGSRS